MYEWIIRYKDDKALHEIKKTGEIVFEPEFEDLKFIIIKSYIDKDTILKIKGVTECREPMIGTVYV